MSQVNEYQARRELVTYLTTYAIHMSSTNFLGAYARLSKIDGLEGELQALADKAAELRDKIRAAGPEFIYEYKPPRRHKTT